MKKLKLSLSGMKEILTKEEMRKITGGSAHCGADCGPGVPPVYCWDINPGATCTSKDYVGCTVVDDYGQYTQAC